MSFSVVLLGYVGLEVLHAGPLDTSQLAGERRTTCRVRQVAWFPWCVHIDSGPSTLVGLTSCFPSALDASACVFVPPLLENVALIASGSRVRRRDGVAVGVGPASRRSWPSGLGVHRGGAPSGLVGVGLRLGALPGPRCARLPGLVAVGEADETVYGHPPVVDLVRRRRVV